MLERAKGMLQQTEAMLGTLRAKALPEDVRQLLHTQAVLNVELAERLDGLERMFDGAVITVDVRK